MRIILTSKNAAKASAVKKYLDGKIPQAELICLEVASGVSPTPFSNEECLLGARTRISHARAIEADADFYIGAEGGVFKLDSFLLLGGWVVVQDNQGCEYIGSSCFIQLPTDISTQLSSQKRLSEILDTNAYNISEYLNLEELGTNGLITKGIYTRIMEFEDALKVTFAQINL